MVISRGYYYSSLSRALVYVLPLLAFGMSSYIRFGTLWLPDVNSVVPQHYLILLLVT